MRIFAHIFFIFLFFLCGNDTVFAQKKTNVILEHSETLSFDKANNFQVLSGNVRFRHENALMYCDSAYFYDGKNSFDAFGHVRVVQDSMTMNADKMYYDGDTRLLRARENVTLNDGNMTLNTGFLDFDRVQNFGYYFGGGKLIDPQFELTSQTGYYYPDNKQSFFKTDVVLINPDFTIKSDTLQYNSATEIVRLVGPSHVYYGDYTVFTTNAWTSTRENHGRLYDYSVITSTDGKRITADSIAFDKNQGWAKTYHNAVLQDSVRKIILQGDYGIFHEDPQSGFLTERPYVIDYSSPDSLFLHADTLSFFNLDSITDMLKAYNNVRFFREDFQGKCDSLVYISTDSVVNMYRAPVLWSEQNQLNGDSVKIYIKDSVPDWIHIIGNAMIVSLEESDSTNFNQLSSRESKGYITDGELRKIEMIGNAISVYFPKDSDGSLVGINKAEGSLMTIFLKEKKLEKIVMTPDSKGILYPPDKAPQEELLLRNFSWQDKIRPKSKDDIFRHE
ncbi:MAG: hypothetical protein LBR52_07230 [Prevotellaceae bacterium]|nr:hypothetical protein [Prevotellaceae bacterium]